MAVAEACRLDGRAGTTAVTAEVSPFTQSGEGVGFAPYADGTERGAVLDGTAEARHGIRIGQRFIVAGRLDVMDHWPAVISGVQVPGFTELRVTDGLADR